LSPGTDSSRMHAMRFLLIQLLLQILLHPGEFHEAAVDLTICCKKAFSFLSQDNSSEGEEEEEEGSAPQFMDVLVDTFLSLLPHSSGPLNYAIEQASR
jgi:DNA polymerase phi